MTYPRKYATVAALGQPLDETLDWDAMVDLVNGFTPAGTFRSPYTLLIDFSTPNWSANNAFQTVYGGASDVGGVDGADCDAVFAAAIAYAKTTQGGKIIINCPLTLTHQFDLSGITHGLIFEGKQDIITLDQNNNVIFDLTKSAGIQFRNLYFLVPNAKTPSNIFLLARETAGASAGNHLFVDCVFNSFGSNADKWIYNYGSELNLWQNCAFYTKTTAVCITAKNIDSVSSPYQTIDTGDQSTTQNYFVDNTIFSQASGCGDPPVEIEGAQHVIFDKIYAGMPEQNNYFIRFRYHATPLSIEGITIRNSRFEQRLLYSDDPAASTNLVNCVIDNVNVIPDGAVEIIDCDRNNLLIDAHTIKNLKLGIAGCTLNYTKMNFSDIDIGTGYAGTEPTINVDTLSYSTINAYSYAHVGVTTKVGICSINSKLATQSTENSGTATVINGQTSTGNIAHKLGYTPAASDFTVVPTNSMGSATKFFVTGIGAVNFEIAVNADPGAGTATFAWSVKQKSAI